jgi:probable rRNA maturation factor
MNEVDLSSENVEPPPWLPDPALVARIVFDHTRRTCWSVGVLLCDEQRIHELNRSFRQIDEPTDVLTFGADANDPTGASPVEGDIAIALPVIEANAAAWGVSVRQEFLRVYVHALLHLAGYTHDGYDLASEGAADHPMLGLQERLVERIEEELCS